MLKGDLSDLPFLELLQALATGAGGTLGIRAPGVEGRVGFQKRRIVCAQAMGLYGMDALIFLSGLKGGSFAFGAEPPAEVNVRAPLEAVLTDLALVIEEWEKLEHVPRDWSLLLRRARVEEEEEGRMLEFLAYADGKTVAEVLAAPARVLTRARLLDRALAEGRLIVLPERGEGPKILLALPYYGPHRKVAYIPRDLYNRWLGKLGVRFKLRVRSPREVEGVYLVEARDHIPERVMLHDRELRRLKAARGTKLAVFPEVGDEPVEP